MSAVWETFQRAWIYAAGHAGELRQAFGEHLWLAAIATGISVAACVPLGVWTSRAPRVARLALNGVNSLRVVPSLAVLFLIVPALGLTTTSAAVALTVLALPPVLANTDAAFRAVERPVLEAARGMGMTPAQVLWRVEFPLALPVILAGIRTAVVEVIASATLAAFVGSGGLGIYITRGFALYDYAILLVGAVPVALLALAAEAMFGLLQLFARRKAYGN